MIDLIIIFIVLGILGLVGLAFILYVVYGMVYWLCGDLIERRREVRNSRKWDEE